MSAALRSAPTLNKRVFRKEDGRSLVLYGRKPIADLAAPMPRGDASTAPNPHLRWHPLRAEWIAYAGHRQHRTFLPTTNPLAPTMDPTNPTEVPDGDYDIAVFENRFPTFFAGAHDAPRTAVPSIPARGGCEVVVYAKDPTQSLATLPLWNIEMLIDVWADRTCQLGVRNDVAYVFPFENRGVQVGVTLQHPHGQIYAYPFVPPDVAREVGEQRSYFEKTGRGLLSDYALEEINGGERIIDVTNDAVAFVPACARWAYESWILPLHPAPYLTDLDAAARAGVARALKIVLLKLDALFSCPMPYVLTIHQAPTDGGAHPEALAHIQIYPALRAADRLKFLAGSELGAGVFTADTLPEEKAADLRRCEVTLD